MVSGSMCSSQFPKKASRQGMALPHKTSPARFRLADETLRHLRCTAPLPTMRDVRVTNVTYVCYVPSQPVETKRFSALRTVNDLVTHHGRTQDEQQLLTLRETGP